MSKSFQQHCLPVSLLQQEAVWKDFAQCLLHALPHLQTDVEMIRLGAQKIKIVQLPPSIEQTDPHIAFDLFLLCPESLLSHLQGLRKGELEQGPLLLQEVRVLLGQIIR